MRIHIQFLFCILFSLSVSKVWADSPPETSWSSDPIELSHISSGIFLPEKAGSSYYLLQFRQSSSSDGITIHRFNSDLTPVAEKSLLNSQNKIPGRVFTWDTSIVVLYSEYSREEGTYHLMADILNEELEEIITEKRLTFHKNPLPHRTPPEFAASMQKNREQIAVVFPQGKNSYQLSVFDKNLNKVDSTGYIIEELEDYVPSAITFRYPDYIVTYEKDDDSETPEKLKFVKGNFQKKNSYSILDIEKDNKYATEGMIKYNPVLRSFHFGGLYYDTEIEEKNGFVHTRWDLHDENDITHFEPVPEEDFYLRRGPEAQDQNLSPFQFANLQLRSDGGIMMILEKITEEQETRFNNSMHGMPLHSTQNYYNYQNIIVSSFLPNGQMDWHEVIKKNQRAEHQGTRFQSFSYAYTPLELIIFYTDPSGRVPSFFIHKLQRNGERTSQILKENFTDNRKPAVTNARQTATDEVIIPVIENGQEVYLLRLNF